MIITVSSHKREEIIDITEKVREAVKKSRVKEGLCHIFVAHATAAVIINENYDPNICTDLLDLLQQTIPQGVWRHDNIDGNADAHLKAAILGPSETVPVAGGELVLGTWQSIMLADLDGPRQGRKIVVTVLPILP